MSFYRVATIEDFDKQKERLSFLPLSVQEKIKEEKSANSKIVYLCRDEMGSSLQDSKKYCEMYLSFIKAYEDFLAGKNVYTEY